MDGTFLCRLSSERAPVPEGGIHTHTIDVVYVILVRHHVACTEGPDAELSKHRDSTISVETETVLYVTYIVYMHNSIISQVHVCILCRCDGSIIHMKVIQHSGLYRLSTSLSSTRYTFDSVMDLVLYYSEHSIAVITANGARAVLEFPRFYKNLTDV